LDQLAPLRSLHPRRVIVVAPHPDDEILGAGGLLHIFGHKRVPVEIIAVTDGEASHPESPSTDKTELRSIRARESAEALKRIGCLDVHVRQLHLPDGHVESHIDRLSEVLEAILFPDDLCLTPWRHDGHPDHDACGAAATRATKSTGTQMLSYLVWTWHWADPTADEDLPWERCRRVELTRRMAARKRWATGAFPSQTRSPNDGLTAPPVLPSHVLRRFWRPFEVFIERELDQ
jgi:LmbE family N-acetylglucosaminyl deacetylase